MSLRDKRVGDTVWLVGSQSAETATLSHAGRKWLMAEGRHGLRFARDTGKGDKNSYEQMWPDRETWRAAKAPQHAWARLRSELYDWRNNRAPAGVTEADILEAARLLKVKVEPLE